MPAIVVGMFFFLARHCRHTAESVLLRATDRASIMAGMDEPIWCAVKPSAEPPLQFGIRDLLIAQTVCAACLGLLVMVGIFAVVVIFVGTLICFTIPVSRERTRLKRFLVDLMGGIVLPALCAIYCVLPFQKSEPPVSIFLVAITIQMLVLLIWLIVGSRFGRWSALIAGVLFVGAIIFGILETILFFLSLLAVSFFGIGLLGFVPILACYAFLGNTAEAMQRARATQGKWTVRLLFALGVVLAVAIPILMHAVAGPRINRVLDSVPWPRSLWFGDWLRRNR